MSWCKFDDRADGEKMALAAAAVGDSAVAFWFRAVLHCSRNRTDGFVDERLIGRFTCHKKPRDVVDALVGARVRPDGVGLLVPCEGGWMVHDYLRYNQSRAQAEAEDSRQQAEKDAGRARAKAARDAKRTVYDQPVRSPDVAPTTKRDETVPYENVPHASPRASPVPSRPVPSQAESAVPAPAAQPVLSELAEQILDAAARLPRLVDHVDAEFASELALIATRAGKPNLVTKALDEAAGTLAARQGVQTTTSIRDLLQRFVRNVRGERGDDRDVVRADRQQPTEPYVHRSVLPLVAPIRKPPAGAPTFELLTTAASVAT